MEGVFTLNKPIKPDKPFLSLEEQLNKLYSIDRNLTEIATDRIEAANLLELVPYHTIINGYKDLYATDDKFESGTTIELLFYTHVIYSTFTSMLFKYILLIEKSLTAKMGYYVAKELGVLTETSHCYYPNLNTDTDDYLCLSHYTGKDKNRILKSIVKQCRSPFDDSLIKYYVTSKNHLPPWIVANDLSFGKTVSWYYISKGNVKDLVTESFFPAHINTVDLDSKKEFIKGSLKQLVQIRDKIAHGNKIIGLSLDVNLPKDSTLSILDNDNILSNSEATSGFGLNDMLSVILSIMILSNNATYATTFYDELSTLLKKNEDTNFNGQSIYQVLCLPNDIENRLFLILCDYYQIH